MTRDTALECYEAAGIGPEDVHVAFCHDAFVNEELEYYELLGFWPSPATATSSSRKVRPGPADAFRSTPTAG